ALQEGGDHTDETRNAGAVVSAQRRLALRFDASSAVHRAGTGAQGHRIEMCHEQPPRARAGTRQRDDEVACLRWQRDLLMSSVEADAGAWRTGGNQLLHDGCSDRPLLPCYALHGQEPNEAFDDMIIGYGEVEVGHTGLLATGAPPAVTSRDRYGRCPPLLS